MATIKSIYALELCSECNLKCGYCPHSQIHRYRSLGLMSEEVFALALTKIAALDQSEELNLTHFGEALLHPDFCALLARVREALPERPLRLITNGLALTDAHIAALAAADVRVTVSFHHPDPATVAVALLKAAGVDVVEDQGFVKLPHNWAGQVNKPEAEYSFDCHFLGESKAVILSNGDLVPCCIDAFGRGKFGTVFDDWEEIVPLPFSLCATCHHRVVT